MAKWINTLVAATVLLVLAMSLADIIATGHFDVLRTSGAACAPILCGALHRPRGRRK